MIRRLFFLVAAALLPSVALAQSGLGPISPRTSSGSGTTTITAGTTATSGCTNGGFLYSLSNLIQCGAILTTDGVTLSATGGYTSTVTSAAGSLFGVYSTLGAGYTGASGTFGFRTLNSAGGTGTGYVTGPSGNFGAFASVNGSTTGTNIGGAFYSQNASSGASIAVLGYQLSSSGTGQKIGGYFYADTESLATVENALTAVLGTTQTGGEGYSTVSSAFLADNGGAAFPIIIAKDNNTIKWQIADGGQPVYSTTVPAVSNTSANSCGTTAATIAGTNETGIVTVGATSGTSCTLTFALAAPNRRQCIATNETSGLAVQSTYSSTTVSILAGTFAASDVIAYVCQVY